MQITIEIPDKIIDLLPEIFAQVTIPQAVRDE